MTFHEKSMILRGFRSPDASEMNYIPIPNSWALFMTFPKSLKKYFPVIRKIFLRESSISCTVGFACDTRRVMLVLLAKPYYSVRVPYLKKPHETHNVIVLPYDRNRAFP